MHRLTDKLTQWPTLIRSWLCNSGANRHEIWARLRKRLKFEIWKISSESVKFHRMKLTMIQTWYNRHEIWVRLRKRLKFEIWKISSESVKFHRMKLTMIQTWFKKKSNTHRLSTPGDKGLIQKVNIFCMGNGHIYAFNTPTKNRANWMTEGIIFIFASEKIGHYFCRRVYNILLLKLWLCHSNTFCVDQTDNSALLSNKITQDST